MKLPKNWGMLLLGVWLILQGAMALIPKLAFEGSGAVLAVLAIAAGVAILLGR